MKTIDLNGQVVEWKIKGSLLEQGLKREARSSHHLRTRELLHELYPTIQIFEEVPIQVYKRTQLYLDFFIPLLKIAVEVHGEQHYEFVPFYHQNHMGFIAQKINDLNKKTWCTKNGFRLIELPYNEDNDVWRNKFG